MVGKVKAKIVCPACQKKRIHTAKDWKHHEFAGHGFQKESGWSHPDLAPNVLPKTSA
jgi:hypothetical protein